MRRWLGIEVGEGRVFAWGTLALGLLGWAEISLRNVSETLFLKRVGVEHLPGVFLLNDVLLLGVTSAFVGAAARSDRLRLLPRIVAGMGVALVPLWAIVSSADARTGFVALLIASKLIPSLALVVFWIAMGDLLHGRQAKRLFAPMTAGATLGTIGGSFASDPLGRLLGIDGLLPLTGGVLLLAAAAALPLRRLRPRLERVGSGALPARPSRSPRDDAEGQSFTGIWRESGLFRLLVVAALCGGILAPMLYWQFSWLADQATQGSGGEVRLLSFYASFRGWINLGVLGAQLFATSGLFRRIGIPLASAIPPVVYGLGFAGLAGQMNLAIGVGAMAATRLQDKAVYDPALRVLFNLFPEAIRSRAAATVEGPVKRAGGAIGNVVVLNAIAVASPIWVGRIALPVAFAWLVAALWLWRLYPRLLLHSAAERVVGDGRLEDAALLDRATVRSLAAELRSPDPARVRAAIALVADAEPALAAEAFASALAGAPGSKRPVLIRALDRVLEAHAPDGLRSAAAARAIEALLREPGALGDRERADLVQAYGRLCDRSPDVPLLRAALADPSPAVRLAATAALARAGAERPGTDLDEAISLALDGGDSVARRTAREELRWMLLSEEPEVAVFTVRLARLARLLDDPEQRVRAAQALADVAERRGAAAACVAEPMLALREDADPRLRAALLRYVGHAGLDSHASWLVAHLGSRDEGCSAAAREGLRALGPGRADLLLRELGFGSRSARTALVDLVRELDVGRDLVASLYDREIEAVARDLSYAAAIGDRPHFAIVRQRLVERIDEQLYAAIELLAAREGDERIAELGAQLRFASGGRRHSILIEALESLLDPRERVRLVPLLEKADPALRARIAAEVLGLPQPNLEEAVEALRADPEELARTLVAGVAPPASESDRLAARDVVGDHRNVKPVEIALQLRSLPFFETLTTRQLVDLAGVVQEVRHDAGACLAREGSFEDCLYLLVEGVVTITRGGAYLAELGPGSFFGEVAVFEGGARSATVTAASRVRLLRLERADLMERMDDLPGLAIGICQALSRRVRELTDRLERERAGGAGSGPASGTR